jgi:hypothetical protein
VCGLSLLWLDACVLLWTNGLARIRDFFFLGQACLLLLIALNPHTLSRCCCCCLLCCRGATEPFKPSAMIVLARDRVLQQEWERGLAAVVPFPFVSLVDRWLSRCGSSKGWQRVIATRCGLRS